MRSRTNVAHSSILALLTLSCSGSSRTANPTPVTDPVVTTTPVAEPDAGTVAAADVASTTVAQAVEDAGPPPEAPIPPMPAGLHGPAQPWARMTDQQKGRYMHDVVMPAMTPLLQAYDPTHFANVTCATCHGTNAREVHFHMPNSLPALPTFGTPAAQQRMAAQHRMYEFMGTRVSPAMAQLLGEQPFNPQTRRGFGCFNCHPHEGAAPGGDAGAAH